MSIFKNNFIVGLTAGLAATILAPVLVPIVKKSARPLAKTLVKGGILAYEKGREAVATAGEMMEDVMAEVRSESQEADAGFGDEQHQAHGHENEEPAAHEEPAARPSPAKTGNGHSHGAQGNAA